MPLNRPIKYLKWKYAPAVLCQINGQNCKRVALSCLYLWVTEDHLHHYRKRLVFAILFSHAKSLEENDFSTN